MTRMAVFVVRSAARRAATSCPRRGLASVVATVFRGASRAEEQAYVSDASGAIRPAKRLPTGGPGAGTPAGAQARTWALQLAAPLLPRDYPASVAPSYVCYATWNMAHTALGSAAGTLSMQALLVSVGVGSTAATPAAAALNWCLKDGAAQVATIASAYAVAHRFDAHPKQWRLAAGWLENGARLLEMCAPFAPALFLPLASASAVGKAIACLAASASKAALHLSLSRAHANLADLTAKAGAQAVVAQLAGTGLGIGISVAATLPHPHAAPAFAVLLAAAHMGTLARALRCVTLTVLDEAKADALASAYMLSAHSLGTADAARTRSDGRGDGGGGGHADAVGESVVQLPTPEQLSFLDDALLPPPFGGPAQRRRPQQPQPQPQRQQQGSARGGAAEQLPTVCFAGPLHVLAPDTRTLADLLRGARERGYVLAKDPSGAATARALLLDGSPPGVALVAQLHAFRLATLLEAGETPAEAHDRARAYAAAHAEAYTAALAAAGWDVTHTLLDTGERLTLAAEVPMPEPLQAGAPADGSRQGTDSDSGDANGAGSTSRPSGRYGGETGATSQPQGAR